MSSLSFSLDVTISEKLFERYFKKAVEKEINNSLKLCIQPIKDRVKLELRWALVNSPEYKSLNGGKLAKEFGFIKNNEENRFLTPLLDWLINQIEVWFVPFSYENGGELNIDLAVFDIDELLNQNFAKYISSNNYEIEWLKWLLLEGNKIIIATHKIEYGVDESNSRDAIMVKGGSWKVPSEYAGTIQSNWIILTFNTIDKQIFKIIQEEFSRNLS